MTQKEEAESGIFEEKNPFIDCPFYDTANCLLERGGHCEADYNCPYCREGRG